MTIEKTDCAFLGTFIKLHGVKGELVLKIDNEYFDSDEMESIFVEFDKQLIPFFIAEEGLRFKNNEHLLIKLQDIETEKQTKEFIGKDAYISKEYVIIPEVDDSDISQLIGFEAFSTQGVIGEIASIIEIPKNPLLQVFNNGKEILVPMNALQINNIDFDTKRVEMTIPEGLLDIYLNE